MSEIAFRTGTDVLLRPLERTDVPVLRRWMNDPETTRYLLRTFPLMEKEEEEWVDGLSKTKNNFVFGIIRKKEKQLIGSIGLHNIHWPHRTATTGTWIGDKSLRGHGYGTEAKMLLLDFAFNALDLYAILSRVMAHNEQSLAYGKKCGYEEVGRIPNWIRTQDGKRCDEVLLVVTQERWRPLWKQYLKDGVRMLDT